jgi:hypothetical protein
LIALLAVEVIGLTIRFDAANAEHRFESLFDLARVSFQVLVVAAGAWLLIRSGENQGVRRPVEPGSQRHWHFVLAHLATFFGFASLTAVLFKEGPRHPVSSCWGAAWVVMGLATLGTWLAVGFSPAYWILWIGRRRGPLLGCAAAGLAAWAIGQFVGQLWRPLGWGTLRVVHLSLRLGYSETVYHPVSF